MSSCIFLLPNSLLSHEQLELLLPNGLPTPLVELMNGSNEPSVCKTIEDDRLCGIATEQWLWSLITKRDGLVPTAPYLWKGIGGMTIAQEFWRLTPYCLIDEKVYPIEENLPFEQECLLRDGLTSLVRKFQFQLQCLNSRYFLVRKKTWAVTPLPWSAQSGKKLNLSVYGEEKAQWFAFNEACTAFLTNSELNAMRIAANQAPIAGFWLDGAGREEMLLPYTQLRSIQTSNPLVRGIADCSGLQTDLITPLSNEWVDCAPGDKLAIFDELSCPSLKNNPSAFQKAFAAAASRIQSLVDSANKVEAHNIVLVATDGQHVSTVVKKPSTGLSFWKKKSNHLPLWLSPKFNN